jgi:molybdopterin-guanine dinucleotide biosynthesis protein B
MSPDDRMDVAPLPATPLSSAARHGLVVGLAGWSGSGKTTLAENLIAKLVEKGRDVATIKHAHHHFDADVPGKDSYRHRTAGAKQVLVSSEMRSVLFTEHGDTGDRPLDDLLASLAPTDIVIVEGFKREPIPKIEIFRSEVGKPPLWPEDEWIVAIATDAPLSQNGANAPSVILDLNNPAAIASFIIECAATGGQR